MAYDPLHPNGPSSGANSYPLRQSGPGHPATASSYADGTPRNWAGNNHGGSLPTDTGRPARPTKPKKAKDDGPKKPSKLMMMMDAIVKDFNDIGGRKWTAPDTALLQLSSEERALSDSAKRAQAEIAELQKTHEKMVKRHVMPGRNMAEADHERQEMELRYRQLHLEREQYEQRRRELAARRNAISQENDILQRQREQELREDRIRQQRELEASRLRQQREGDRFKPGVDLPTRGQQLPFLGPMRGASTASPYRDPSYLDPYSNLAHDPLSTQIPHTDDPLSSVYSRDSLRNHQGYVLNAMPRPDDRSNILRNRTNSDPLRPSLVNNFASKLSARLNPPPKPNIPTNPYLPQDDRLEFAIQRAAAERERQMRESLIGKSQAEQAAIVREFQLRERLARLSPEERERMHREQEDAIRLRRQHSMLGRDGHDPLAGRFGIDPRLREGAGGFGRGPGVGGRGGLDFDSSGLGLGRGGSGGFGTSDPLLRDPLRSYRDGGRHSPPFGVGRGAHHDPFLGPPDPDDRDHHGGFPSLGRHASLGGGGFPSLGGDRGGLGHYPSSSLEHGLGSRGGLGGGLGGGGSLGDWRRTHGEGGLGTSNAYHTDPLTRSAPAGRGSGIDGIFADIGRGSSTSGLGNGSGGLYGDLRSGETTPGSGAAELLRGMGLSSTAPPMSRPGTAPGLSRGPHDPLSADPLARPTTGQGVRFANVPPTPLSGSPRTSPMATRTGTPGVDARDGTTATTDFGSTGGGGALGLFSSPRQPPTDLFGAARQGSSLNSLGGGRGGAGRSNAQLDDITRQQQAAEAEVNKLEREAVELDRKLAANEAQTAAMAAAKAGNGGSGLGETGDSGSKKKKGKGGKAPETGLPQAGSAPDLASAQATLAGIAANSGLRAEDLELVTADEASREAALSSMTHADRDQLLQRLSRLSPQELDAIRTLEQASSQPSMPPLAGQHGKQRVATDDSIPFGFPEPSVPPPAQPGQGKSKKKGGGGDELVRTNFQSTSKAAFGSPAAPPPLAAPGSPLDDLRDLAFGPSSGFSGFGPPGRAPNEPSQVQHVTFPEAKATPPDAAAAPKPNEPGAPNPPGQGKKKKKGKGGGEAAEPSGDAPTGIPAAAPAGPPPAAGKPAKGSPAGSIRAADVFNKPETDLRDFPVIPAGHPVPFKVERFIDHVLTVLPPPPKHIRPDDMAARHEMTAIAVQNLIQSSARLGANAIVEFRFGEVEPGVVTAEGDAVLLNLEE